MDDEDFRKLFERLIENYELDPEVADKLLQQILEILYGNKDDDGG